MFSFTHLSRKSSSALQGLEAKLDMSNYFVQLCLFYLLSYAALVVFIPVAVILPSAGDESARLRLTAGVFTVLVVAPIIETLIFQKIMYALLTRSVYFQRRRWMLIFVSSLLFGAWHFDSVSHVLMATISGVVLMYVYVYYLPNYNRAFWSTVIIHFAHNMTTFLVMKYLL